MNEQTLEESTTERGEQFLVYFVYYFMAAMYDRVWHRLLLVDVWGAG